jgi:hypothetical protein
MSSLAPEAVLPFTIHPDLQALIPPLTAVEYAQIMYYPQSG